MRVILWVGSDGSIRETYPTVEPLPDESDEDFCNRIAQKRLEADAEAIVTAFKEGKEIPPSYQRIENQDTSTLPDQYFRDAWTHDGKSIVVDFDKAKAIHQEKLIALRKVSLPEVQLKMLDAIAADDDATLATVKKKYAALRNLEKDLPEMMKKIKTVEELKSFVPDILK